jgi:aldose 1-epimerase
MCADTAGDFVSDRIAIETEQAIVEALPRLGGAFSAFDLKRGSERVPIFRRWAGESETPRSLAATPVVPWFNRISGGGIQWNGRFYPIAPNDPLDAFPLHGDGWMTAWQVAEHTPARIVLTLRSHAIPPFDYEARQVFSLAGSALDFELSVTHCGEKQVPYGLGHHPWFPRTRDVTLKARATGMWREQPPDFPTSVEAGPTPPEWDFSAPRPLPDVFTDNGFAGWDGHAAISWPERRVALNIEADRGTRFYHVYAPGPDKPFFCFEPVTHQNNAFGKPGGPAANALRVLEPGETMSMGVRYAATVT